MRRKERKVCDERCNKDKKERKINVFKSIV